MEQHDLYDFFLQASERIQSGYDRITRRSKQDSGTAGDEGEENWATLLEKWLPKSYTVRTKGQILSSGGQLSRQVDVVILKPSYPLGLIDDRVKKYLAAGVAAAFECKLTLRSKDLKALFDQAQSVYDVSIKRKGTPFKELFPSIPYGLLAHSHSWKSEQRKVIHRVGSLLYSESLKVTTHPAALPEMLCIGDVGSWHITREAYREQPAHGWGTDNAGRIGSEPAALTRYTQPIDSRPSAVRSLTPIGAFVLRLWWRLAWEDPSLRPIADELHRIPGMRAFGGSSSAVWPMRIYGPAVRERLQSQQPGSGYVGEWDEWDYLFL